MEIKKGDTVKVVAPDLSQTWWNELWHGTKYVPVDAVIQELIDYQDGRLAFIMVKLLVRGEVKKVTASELGYLMSEANPNVFAKKIDKFNI